MAREQAVGSHGGCVGVACLAAGGVLCCGKAVVCCGVASIHGVLGDVSAETTLRPSSNLSLNSMISGRRGIRPFRLTSRLPEFRLPV